MAFELKVRESISLGGKAAASQATVSADGLVSKSVTVAAAKTGQLTTRTSDTAGELTMASGHGITTGARLDVYWSGGSRRGITVGTVATNQVPLTTGTGAGDVLPANLTNVTACVPSEEVYSLTGNNVKALEFYSSRRGIVVLADSGDAELLGKEVGDGNVKSYVWFPERDPVNPIAGDSVAKVFFSNGDSAQSTLIRAQALYD